MRVRFWGTRGSLPVAARAETIQAKVARALVAAGGRRFADEAEAAAFCATNLEFATYGGFGGATSCVEIEGADDAFIVCDLGSGLREFGIDSFRRIAAGHPPVYHLFLSHLHWDHIMGLPFFTPAYIPGNRLVIHGCHERLREAFVRQQAEPSFPVDFSIVAKQIEFVTLEPGRPYQVAGLIVTPKKQLHAGDSYGYRFEAGGRAVVYSTDSEHKLDDPQETRAFVEFFRAADVVIFDAMYSLADAISVKADWGHSSNVVGVELCQLAGVKHLVMYHHEPAFDDAAIERVLADTRRFEEITRSAAPLKVSAAYDGMEIAL